MAKQKKKFGLLLGAAALLFLFVRAKKNTGMIYSAEPLSDQNIKESFRKIFNEFGREKTEMLERLFRWETSHFDSGQFLGTKSPGMEPSPNNNKVFPFGWNSLKNFAVFYNIPATAFNVSGPYTEGGTGRPKYFVGFPNVYIAMLFVMYVIEQRKWNFGKWFSFNEASAINYVNNIKKVTPKITNTF